MARVTIQLHSRSVGIGSDSNSTVDSSFSLLGAVRDGAVAVTPAILCSTGPMPDTSGLLVLAGTPIGDVEDASPRLRAELAAADVIAAEDTRRLHGLLQRLGMRIDAPVVSYFEGNESARTPGLVADLQAGKRVVLVTDAGMP